MRSARRFAFAIRSLPLAAMERISFSTLSITIGTFFHSESFQAGEFAYAAHFCFCVVAVLLHHLAHVGVLLQDLIYFLHRRAAAERDAFAPLAVNQIRIRALLGGHGINDCF